MRPGFIIKPMTWTKGIRMKRLRGLLAIVFALFAGTAFASDMFTLSVAKVVVVEEQAVKFEYIDTNILENIETIRVTYAWRDVSGERIQILGQYIHTYDVRNTRDDLGQLVDTHFNDIMGYTIQAGDAGKSLGPALKKTLIMNKVKAALGFDGTWD